MSAWLPGPLLPFFHTARADFRERVRAPGFLVTLAGVAGCGYFVHTGNIALSLGGVRGVHDSAWIGTLLGVVVTSFLSLAGFYLTKNTLERDRRSGVGEILAASPLSRVSYVFGKAASNFLVLATLVGLLALSGIAVQLISGEDRTLSPVAFLLPLAALALPVLALTAAVAVLFESVRWLRGAFGNTVYFFLWTASLTVSMLTPFDVTGLQLVQDSMRQSFAGHIADANRELSFNVGPQQGDLVARPFAGIDWTAEALAGRLAWFLAALALAGLATLFFRRFEPARDAHRAAKSRSAKPRPGPLSRLPRLPTPQSPFPALVMAELRLALRGLHPAGLLIAAGLIVAALFVPAASVRSVVLPIAWIWPLAVWSPLGTREARAGTGALVFTSPRPVWFHAAAIWLSGVIVAALAGSGVLARLLLLGDGPGLLAWTAGCLFVPGLAFAVGSWTGSGRAFEILYLLLWYAGPMDQTPTLDYLGATAEGPAQGVPLVFLGLTVALLAAAVVGRRRRMVAAA